ncbi:MAG: hypothetical protein ACI303_06990, partial [Lepagella sp.]
HKLLSVRLLCVQTPKLGKIVQKSEATKNIDKKQVHAPANETANQGAIVITLFQGNMQELLHFFKGICKSYYTFSNE